MQVQNVIFVLISIFSVCKCGLLKEKEYAQLPPIFVIEDQKQCNQEKKTYCRASIILTPQDNTSTVWQNIMKTKRHREYYNHDELFHAICVENMCPEFREKQDLETLSRCYTRKYQDLGLGAKVVRNQCEYRAYTVGFNDVFYLIFIMCYISFVIAMTVVDYNAQKTMSKSHKLVTTFSMYTNWKKLNKINTNPDFQKLKCIQGIRFYNMLLIIFCHTFSSYIGGYVENTIYFETIYLSPSRNLIRNLMVFLVQTFFLFSAWLLSYHSFQIMEKPKENPKHYMSLTFLNRYLRIVPPILIMIAFACNTVLYKFVFFGPLKDVYTDTEYERCRKNWWSTIFFVNNVSYEHDLCYFITWYLSADTQLYAISVILFGLLWKFKKNALRIIFLCISFGVIINSSVSYLNNLDNIYRLTPENSKITNYRSFEFNATYSSTYSNLTTFMIGILFGYIYYKYKERNLFDSKIKCALWYLLFPGLPLMSVYLSSRDYSRVTGAILVGFLKPLYAIGIGIGILGMKDQVGGIVKRICEWETAVFMGNFTYSTYVVHYVFVFYRTFSTTKPLYVSDFILITSFLQDVIFSFINGFTMHIMLEMPVLQLQNMYVPQIKRKTKESGKD